MDESKDQSLEARVEHLERALAALQRHLGELPGPAEEESLPPSPALRTHQATPAAVEPAQPVRPQAVSDPVPRTSSRRSRFGMPGEGSGVGAGSPGSLQKSESWINRIGIGLLLFGLAFLFKCG